ncbi:uncharacterized protein LOC143301911 [Babylonia areolata]|uniref:uncharacterized protein LOC143301911 n=1 Tax=Babylonia areolata TaxID=304850 RepID=UPI003FD2B625
MCLPLFLLLLLLSLAADGVRGQTAEERVAKLENVVTTLTRQVMLQQLFVEESIRNTQDSGIKQVRRRRDGGKSYQTETIASGSIGTIHNHANNVRTVGMGELAVVLNGVEFRTRHNDFGLRMPSRTSTEYNAVEDIPYPDVPPEVLNKPSIEEQSAEMKEWIKAWLAGDSSVRDYRKYFKPNLCYLEGAWTNVTSDAIEEPFTSDRHFLEAETWYELQDNIRFTSYTGTKSMGENYAFLPTTIMNITADGIPEIGQWNYRILCHPIEGGLELSVFQPVDNLGIRLLWDKTWDSYLNSRFVRYRLVGPDDTVEYSLIDDLMYQVPGKDGYSANLSIPAAKLYKYNLKTGKLINTAFYHRSYEVDKADAMGLTINAIGYADRNLFIADTTQDHVAAASVNDCKIRKNGKKVCTPLLSRVSYAFPLEVVYTTPLLTWNPYDIEYKGDYKSDYGRTVVAGSATGEKDSPYNGTNSKNYMRTPCEFFSGEDVIVDKADTTKSGVWVLDKKGVAHCVSSSGTRIHLPNIPGVGEARIRWPIMAVSTEGHQVWKELEALRDVVMDMKTYLSYFPTTPPLRKTVVDDVTRANVRWTYQTSPSDDTVFTQHVHLIHWTKEEHEAMRTSNFSLVVTTDEALGHRHEVVVRYGRKFQLVACDGSPTCYDGHTAELSRPARN